MDWIYETTVTSNDSEEARHYALLGWILADKKGRIKMPGLQHNLVMCVQLQKEERGRKQKRVQISGQELRQLTLL